MSFNIVIMDIIKEYIWKGLFIVMALAFLVAALYLVTTDTGIGSDYKQINMDERISNAELSQQVQVKRSDKAILFGFDLRSSLIEDVRQYIPFLMYLERASGYKFRLKIVREKGSSIADEIGKGNVHFSIIGAGTYLSAHEKYDIVPVVRGLNPEGKAGYQSVIIVAPNSQIQKIGDLKGKRFAFGDKYSTQSHIIPRIILEGHGIGIKDLASYKYIGSHLDVANAVVSGTADAGGIQDNLGRRLAKEGLVRIIYVSKYYPSSGIAMNKNVPPDILKKVRHALLDFQPKGRDSAGLYHWDRTEMPNGFITAADEDYAELRQWMRRFGLLPETGKRASEQ